MVKTYMVSTSTVKTGCVNWFPRTPPYSVSGGWTGCRLVLVTLASPFSVGPRVNTHVNTPTHHTPQQQAIRALGSILGINYSLKIA